MEDVMEQWLEEDGPTDVPRKLGQIQDALERIEAKLDRLLKRQRPAKSRKKPRR